MPDIRVYYPTSCHKYENEVPFSWASKCGVRKVSTRRAGLSRQGSHMTSPIHNQGTIRHPSTSISTSPVSRPRLPTNRLYSSRISYIELSPPAATSLQPRTGSNVFIVVLYRTSANTEIEHLQRSRAKQVSLTSSGRPRSTVEAA
jgi:hypothetical protein